MLYVVCCMLYVMYVMQIAQLIAQFPELHK